MIAFTVPGKPIQWQRARRSGKRYFTAEDHARHMRSVAWQARLAMRSHEVTGPQEGPIGLHCVFLFEPPASLSAPKRAALIGRPYVVKRKNDGDNLLKLIMDALSGVAYVDDGQVCDFHVTCRYAAVAQTDVCVVRIEDKQLPAFAGMNTGA